MRRINPFSLAAEAKRAVDSVGENLSDIGTMFIDPLGTNVEKDLTDVDEQAALQEVGSGHVPRDEDTL